MRTVICEGCEGAGWVYTTGMKARKRCRVCDGEGRMEIPEDRVGGISTLAYTVAAVLAVMGAIYLAGHL